MLVDRVRAEDKVDAEKLLRRRTSVGTVATVDTVGDTNPLAFSGTAGDVDRVAEEHIGVLAMHCLKSIFIVTNRPQIYVATGALLKFIFERVQQAESIILQFDGKHSQDEGWATKIYSLIARWAPVQDRYTILVAALDTLARLPLQDQSLDQHIVLVAMISSLLRSDVNLIGLSVMDVLLGLIKQMKKLLQLPRSTPGTEAVMTRKLNSILHPSPDPSARISCNGWKVAWVISPPTSIIRTRFRT